MFCNIRSPSVEVGKQTGIRTTKDDSFGPSDLVAATPEFKTSGVWRDLHAVYFPLFLFPGPWVTDPFSPLKPSLVFYFTVE
jgi:hypothetical protein